MFNADALSADVNSDEDLDLFDSQLGDMFGIQMPTATESTVNEADIATEEVKYAEPEERPTQESKPEVFKTRPPPVRVQEDDALENAAHLKEQFKAYVEKSSRDQSFTMEETSQERAIVQYIDEQLVQLTGQGPPRLREKAYLASERNAVLKDAVKNRMLRPFLMGLDRACNCMYFGLTQLAIARALLEQCLKQQKFGTQGREDLGNLSQMVNTQMNNVVSRTNALMEQMGILIRDVGTAAKLLEYDASVDVLLTKLKHSTDGLEEKNAEADNMEEFDKAVGAVTAFIHARLTEEDGYARVQKDVADQYQRWQNAFAEYQRLLALRDEERRRLVCERARLKGLIDVTKKSLQLRQQAMESFQPRLDGIDGRIADFETRKENLVIDEHKEQPEPAVITQEVIKEEVKFQAEVIKKQIEELEKARLDAQTRGDILMTSAHTADDGTERVVVQEHSFYTWWSSEEAPDRVKRVVVGTDDKARLTGLAQEWYEKGHQIERRMENLRQERKQLQRKVLRDLKAEQVNVTELEARGIAKGYERKRVNLDSQIALLTALKITLKGERNTLEVHIHTLNDNIAKMKAAADQTKEQLQRHESQTDPNYAMIEVAATNEKRERKQIAEKQKALDDFVFNLGLYDMDQFDRFEKTLNLLKNTVENIPMAMNMLNSSLKSARQMFEAEMFRKNLECLSGSARKMYLIHQTSQVQTLCEMCWTALDAPVRHMMMLESGELVQKLAEMPKIESGDGPVVEEAKEE